MRSTIIGITLALAAFTLMAGEEHRHHRSDRGRSISINDPDDGPMTSCDQLNVRFDGDRVPVVSEELAGTANLRSIRIASARNSGVRVSGWNESRYGVTVCKAAAAGEDLSRIRVRLDGNTLVTDYPESSLFSNRFVVYYIVRVPRNADVDVKSTSGPVAVEQASGRFRLDTTNGPISLKDVEGTIDARAKNGPISFAGNRGDVRLSASNGPISVKLQGGAWLGGSLDAETSNGPVTLKLPRNYASGVLIESDGNGPVSCKAEACKAAYMAALDRDDDFPFPRKLEFGSGSPVVKLSTSNGPISIKEVSEF